MQSVLIQFDGADFLAQVSKQAAEATIIALQQMGVVTSAVNPPKSAQKTPLTDETMLTRQDIRNMFNVSLTTCDAWVKQKRLKSTKIGGRRYFRQSDVTALFEQSGRVKRG